MNEYASLNEWDLVSECKRIASFIESKKIELKRDGVLLGLSGGLDSAVVAYLAAQGMEKSRIHLFNLPDKDSKDRHRRDALTIASNLGIPLEVRDITPILTAAGVYDLIPLHYVPGRRLKELLVAFGKKATNLDEMNLLSTRLSSKANSMVARSNAYISIKHRVRMLMLYQHAEVHNLLVLGAANKTELLTGTFTQWGCDHCADIMPIIHLYRTQLELMAEHLNIPIEIRRKPADPDLIPGVDNKEKLLGTFSLADQILWELQNGVGVDTLKERFDENDVDRLADLFEASRFMREVPYSMEKITES